jgi:transcriptional regulator with XRE-family HTH domain
MESAERTIYYLRQYVNLLESHLDQGEIEDWRYSFFQKLSEEIRAQSGVKVSHTTLIRILQKRAFKRSPQPATLNALAQYLDFENWTLFCQSVQEPEQIDLTIFPPDRSLDPKQLLVGGRKYLVLFGSLALLALAAGWIWMSAGTPDPVYLTCTNPVGDYPHHFSFRYKIPEVQAHLEFEPRSFYPHQGQDLGFPPRKPRPEQKHYQFLSPRDSFASYPVTLSPESYWVHLKAGNDVLASTSVFVRTRAWLVELCRTQAGGPIRGTHQPNEAGLLKPPPSLLARFPFDQGSCLSTKMTFCDSTKIDGNAFRLDTRFRLGKIRYPMECEYARVKIQTTRGMIEVPFTDKGCLSELFFFASDYYASSRNTDLSRFAVGLDDWLAVSIQSQGQQVSVFLDGEHLLDMPFQEPLGEITCFKYSFLGEGQVDYLRVYDETGKMRWGEEFEPSLPE